MAANQPPTVAESKEIAEENQETLNYKTWVLKVSIHCEGCKRKVKKILASIYGVHTTDIDLKQQQVTVTGTVDADTLINKLVKKTGKHAVLLHGQNPLLTDTADADHHKVKKQPQTNKQTTNQESKNETVKPQVKLQENPSPLDKNNNVTVVKNTEPGRVGVNGKLPADVSGDDEVKQSNAEVKLNLTGDTGNQSSVVAENKRQVKESKVDVKQSVTGDTGKQSLAVASGDRQVKESKNVTGDTGNKNCDSESSSTGSSKMKKKKGHKRNNATSMEGLSEQSTPVYTGSTQNYVSPANNSPTRHYEYHSPAAHYYAPPVPVVSYNTVNPGTSYGYYTSPSPYNSYAYLNPGTEREVLPANFDSYVTKQPSDFDSYVVSQPFDSIEVFSDENSNACSLM